MSDGSSWSRPRAVPGAHSSHSPALVAGHHGLHLYWKGPGADERLFHAAFDGRFWIPGQALFNGWPGRSGAGRADRLLLAWPDQNGAVWCALSQDAAQHWSQPAPVPARTLRGVAFAGWDTVDAYAAWAVAPDGDYSIFWADTTGSTVWRHPHTGHLLQHGQGRLDERASLREPAMAAHGHMWR
ncbi:hypothetical protein [Streptomyces capuensis]|uniref:hypothetical protein n=1 Tax=Streptomyces capuensis TaxID=1464056 RepID=UPI0004BE7B91|nr:hypothetical protein [Streptomyces capuensis]